MTTTSDDAAAQVGPEDQAFEVGDVDDAVAHLSAAVRERTAAGDRRPAALACARLGDLFALSIGNLTAARSWYTRAIRLLDAEPPCIEQGWVAVASWVATSTTRRCCSPGRSWRWTGPAGSVT